MSKKLQFKIDIPSYDSLSDEQKEAGESPVSFPSFEDAMAFARAMTAHDRNPSAAPTGSPLGDLLARELLQGLVRAGQDSPTLANQVAGVLRTSGALDEPDVLLMKKAEYAKRIGYSVRTLDKFIAAGLPTRGSKKRVRIVVKAADEWMLRQEADQLDEIDLLATENAGKGGDRGSNNG